MSEARKLRLTCELVLDRSQGVDHLPEAVWSWLTQSAHSAPFVVPTRCGLYEPMRPCDEETWLELWREDELGYFFWSGSHRSFGSAGWLASVDDRSSHGSVTFACPLGTAAVDAAWLDLGRWIGAMAGVVRLEPEGSRSARSLTYGGRWRGLPAKPVLAALLPTGQVLAGDQYEAALLGVAPSKNDVTVPPEDRG